MYMPRRYKKRVPKKKKRRRSKRNVSNMVVFRGPQIIPDRIRTKMSYTTAFQVTASGLTDTLFRGNGAFDPEYAVGGGQPQGFDQLATLYGRYIVRSSAIRARCVNRASTIVERLVVLPSTSATAITSANDAVDSPYSKERLISGNAGMNLGTVSSYQTTKSIRGIIGPLVDDELEALTSANPVKEWYWHVVASAFDGSSPTAIDLEVKITYYIDFFKRRALIDA